MKNAGGLRADKLLRCSAGQPAQMGIAQGVLPEKQFKAGQAIIAPVFPANNAIRKPIKRLAQSRRHLAPVPRIPAGWNQAAQSRLIVKKVTIKTAY